MASKPKNASNKDDAELIFDPMVLEHVSPLSVLYFLRRGIRIY